MKASKSILHTVTVPLVVMRQVEHERGIEFLGVNDLKNGLVEISTFSDELAQALTDKLNELCGRGAAS